MSDPTPSHRSSQVDEFARQAAGPSHGVIREFWGFLKQNKKWWLLPIIVSLLVLGLIMIVGGSLAAPFIYTLF